MHFRISNLLWRLQSPCNCHTCQTKLVHQNIFSLIEKIHSFTEFCLVFCWHFTVCLRVEWLLLILPNWYESSIFGFIRDFNDHWYFFGLIFVNHDFPSKELQLEGQTIQRIQISPSPSKNVVTSRKYEVMIFYSFWVIIDIFDRSGMNFIWLSSAMKTH